MEVKTPRNDASKCLRKKNAALERADGGCQTKILPSSAFDYGENSFSSPFLRSWDY